MLKTKILWFTYGFVTASAGITVLVAKKLWASRERHSTRLTEKFGSLETRISYLEKGLPGQS